MTTLIEVAVYAAVMASGTSLSCSTDDLLHVRCSNGVRAELGAGTTIRYSNGLTVKRDDKDFPVFSDGTRSWLDAAGWLSFSNGVRIRKYDLDTYLLSTGIECETKLPQLVMCAKRKPDPVR